MAILLAVFGILSREVVLISNAVLLFYLIFSSAKEGLILFIASIPIFVALPISESFDSLSAGRIFLLVLFLKWIFERRLVIWTEFKSLTFGRVFKDYKLELFSLLLFIVLALSIINAPYLGVAIKRLIYLANLSVIFIIVKDLIRDKEYLKQIINSIFISFVLVFVIGLIQLISVYFFTIGEFWNWWADHVSFNFYGSNLRDIVKNANAWFAYSPAGPSIVRLFGSFTDPHSFALYLLIVCPVLYIFIFPILKDKKVLWKNFRRVKFNNWILGVLFILTLFFVVLSGTRGIWLSVFCGVIAAIYLLITKTDLHRSVSYILLTIVIFICLIPISSIFTTIPQFREKIGDVDAALVLKRLSSILDINETSNQGRIYIWKKSLEIIKRSSFLGIGIGNFPITLDQEIKLAKAGSSAHNLYLNFFVEGGLLSFLLVILIFSNILFSVLFILKSEISPKLRLLISGIFIYLVWIFAYSFFDIALLDERVFLIFLSITAIIYAVKRNTNLLDYE